MTIILLWIVSSAAIGWFGRRRVVGFWGFFVLSLLISPILTGLFLLVAAPGKTYVAETEQRVAESFRRAGFHPRESHARKVRNIADSITARTPGVIRLAEAWVVVVVVFAGVFFVAGSYSALSSFGLADAARLSFDVGTLGSGGDDVAAVGMVTWLAGMERLLVLAILVLIASSLISTQLAGLRVKDQVAAPPAPPASPSSSAQVVESAPAEHSIAS